MTVARLGVYCGQMGMADRDIGSADGLGLADAIALLRDELLEARVAGAGSDIQLPVESMTVDLTVTATRHDHAGSTSAHAWHANTPWSASNWLLPY